MRIKRPVVWILFTTDLLMPCRALTIGLGGNLAVLACCVALNLVALTCKTTGETKFSVGIKRFAFNVAVPMLIVNAIFFPQDLWFMAKVKSLSYSTDYCVSRPPPFEWASLNYDEEIGFWVMD